MIQEYFDWHIWETINFELYKYSKKHPFLQEKNRRFIYLCHIFFLMWLILLLDCFRKKYAAGGTAHHDRHEVGHVGPSQPRFARLTALPASRRLSRRLPVPTRLVPLFPRPHQQQPGTEIIELESVYQESVKKTGKKRFLHLFLWT